jgi:outer membrane protein
MEKSYMKKDCRNGAIIVLMAIFLFFQTASWSAAAGDGERRLTLDEAVRTALADSHEIKAQRNSALAKQNDIGIARSYLLPKITFEERYLRTTNPGWAFMSKLNQARIEQKDFNPDLLNQPDAVNDYQSSLMIEQPIFVRKAFIGLDMSRTETEASAAELKRKREEVTYQVIKAGLAVGSAKAYARAIAEGVEDAREHQRVAELRYKNGLSQYADILRTATALTEARQRKNMADKNVSLAKRGLGLLLATEDAIDIVDDRIDLPFHDIAYYSKEAEKRSDLKAAELRGENARKNVKLAEASYFPYLGVGGSYQFNDHNQPFGSEGRNWQVMTYLRWDLFDGTKREYERVKAKHLASQAEEYVSALRKGVSYRIYEAYLNCEEARKNIELAREALLTAEEGRRLLKLRYENGLTPLADLLNAQSSLEQARAGLVERDNAYRVALATLSFESGTILADMNIEK